MTSSEDEIKNQVLSGDNSTVDTLFEAIASSNLAHTLASVDGDRPLIYVNQAFLDETGYTHDEVIGRNCRFLQGEGTDPETVQKIRDSLEKFEPIDIEILNYRKDGTPFLNRLRMSTVFGEDGKPLAYMGIQSNVNTLVEKVRSTQEKYKMESLGRLSANVSHEIKNALQPIRLMLENLEDFRDLSQEQIGRCVDVAMDNMNIAENIVKDVLRFSQGSASDKQKTPALELVNNSVRFAKNLVPKTAMVKVEIAEEVKAEDIAVEVHQNGIFQIVTNLVNNALDATGQKGLLTLTASIAEFGAASSSSIREGKYLQISLEDDGSGIDEAAIESIFHPFFSTKSPTDGTGLGLAVSMKIIQDHKGSMNAENLPDGGAKFNLFLPLVEA